jgi:hypothetical protein
MGSGQRAPAKTFQDLIVWQKAHEFVLEVYRVRAGFPKATTCFSPETWGTATPTPCCNRLTRSAVSWAHT